MKEEEIPDEKVRKLNETIKSDRQHNAELIEKLAVAEELKEKLLMEADK